MIGNILKLAQSQVGKFSVNQNGVRAMGGQTANRTATTAAEQQTVQQAQGKEERKEADDNTQLIEVTYGHRWKDKRYSYYASNKRTGDTVTPEVNHRKSGKLYKTLAIVRATRKVTNAQDEITDLTGRGIGIKTIGSTNQRALPGYFRGWGNAVEAKYARLGNQLRQ